MLQRGFFISDTNFSNPQLGYTGDWLFQKRFQPRSASRSFGLHNAQLQGASQVGNITWNIFERINLQVELGSGQFEWQWKQDPSLFFSGKIADGFICNGSVKAIFFEVKETSIAADAHVGGWNGMRGEGIVGGIPIKRTVHSKMHYWQLGVAVTQKISIFSPYLGIVSNQTELKISRLSTGTGRLRSRHKMGAFGGCTLSSGSYFFLNLEWRCWFEHAFSLAGQLRF